MTHHQPTNQPTNQTTTTPIPQAGAATTALPRAHVTESNGEVSCSVEETNRIRALLGLRVSLCFHI